MLLGTAPSYTANLFVLLVQFFFGLVICFCEFLLWLPPIKRLQSRRQK